MGLQLSYLVSGLQALVADKPGYNPPGAFDLHLDPRVLGYTGGLSILTALLFGLAPAIREARADVSDTLKAQTRSVMGGRFRLPRLLVSIQIALCLTALVAAGLLGRTLENLKWMDVGFDRENLAYASVNPWRDIRLSSWGRISTGYAKNSPDCLESSGSVLYKCARWRAAEIGHA